ncbi:Type 1 glutamine amidotransferase-like domain-containing protein [Terribacillus sp. 179-K 1B1 HS]|uniref:Type 1 glutamine amidotransferase-like domain-containing protein n=1 Tax=Terribacillus sp. 179-K 1B1 HS TaxID=3142388 RepID=UPI0039A0A5F9
MGTLFLSGGGNEKQTITIDRMFVNEIDKEKPLLYIPIAMDEADYNDCFNWIRKVFTPLGMENIVLWSSVNNKCMEDLSDFSAIYIGGGNTFTLLKKIKDSKFYRLLRLYLNNGGIVYGGSAGAIILGENIMTCAHLDRNTANVSDFQGMGMIGKYSVWCHFRKNEQFLVTKFVKDFDCPVIALPEETAIFIKDKGNWN